MAYNKFNVGMYIRLSREDGDKQESESIGNQRNIIKRFLKENSLEVTSEYVDDGVSGTTFDRSGFNRLINDIENKKINMIVTKDLSRLGRDYIKTGYYIENYFPENKVRYVAILDGIDTYADSTNNDITPFKAIMNDMYAKDISKKIKSVFKEKQKNGQFLGSVPPYGYKINKEKKGKLEIDNNTAPIVKKIFEMYSNEHGTVEIAKYLNKNNVLTPSDYRKGCKTKEWNQATILEILRNSVYIGNTVQNKRKKLSYKSKKIISNPEEEWVQVNNTHEPIIDVQVFEKVQTILKGKSTSKYSRYEYIFKGILKCYYCDRNLQIVLKSANNIPYINCVGNKARGGHPISMNYWKFENSVLEIIKKICVINLDRKIFLDEYNQYENRKIKKNDNSQNDLEKIKNDIEKINVKMDEMYFDKLNGLISKYDYIRYCKKVEDEKKNLISKQEDISNKIKNMQLKKNNETNLDKENNIVEDIVNNFLQMNKIDKIIMYKLIKYIQIDSEKNIYIYFNFNDSNIIKNKIEN